MFHKPLEKIDQNFLVLEVKSLLFFSQDEPSLMAA